MLPASGKIFSWRTAANVKTVEIFGLYRTHRISVEVELQLRKSVRIISREQKNVQIVPNGWREEKRST